MSQEKWDYPVALRELQIPEGDKLHNRLATIDESTGQILGTVSKRYNLIQNRQLVDIISQAGENIKLKLNSSDVAGGRRITIFNYSLDREAIVSKSSTPEDKVRFGFEVVNSFDSRLGSGHFRAYCNRLTCLNGLIVPREIRKVSFRELGFFSNSHEAFERLNLQIAPILNVANTWNQWADILPNHNRVDSFIEANFSKKVSKVLLDAYNKGSDQSVWGLYNVLTYHTTHELTSRNLDNLHIKKWKVENTISKMYNINWN